MSQQEISSGDDTLERRATSNAAAMVLGPPAADDNHADGDVLETSSDKSSASSSAASMAAMSQPENRRSDDDAMERRRATLTAAADDDDDDDGDDLVDLLLVDSNSSGDDSSAAAAAAMIHPENGTAERQLITNAATAADDLLYLPLEDTISSDDSASAMIQLENGIMERQVTSNADAAGIDCHKDVELVHSSDEGVSVSSLNATTLSLLCLLNNKAVNHMERQEYDQAEAKLQEALELSDIRRDERRKDEQRRQQFNPSPTTVVVVTIFDTDNDDVSVAAPPSQIAEVRAPYIGSHIQNWSLTYQSLPEPTFHFDDCLDSLPKLLRLGSESTTNRHATATIFYNFARLYYMLSNFDAALDFYEEASCRIMIDGPVTATEDGQQLRLLIACGRAATLWQKFPGDKPSHIHAFAEAVECCRTVHGSKSIELTSCLNAYAIVNYQCGCLQTALDTLNENMLILNQVCGLVDHPNLGACCNNLGRVLSLMGRCDEALAAYERALKINRFAYGGSKVSVGIVLFNIGNLQRLLGRLDDSLDAFQEFLAIVPGLIEYLPMADFIVTTYCIASLYLEKKNLAGALKACKSGLTIALRRLGPDHVVIASVYNRLGHVYHAIGDFEAALHYYHSGLAIEIDNSRPSSFENRAVTYRNIGMVHEAMMENALALRYYERAIRRQRMVSLVSAGIADTLQLMANVHRSMKKYDDAFEAIQEALRIRREVFGDIHQSVAAALIQTLLCLLRMSRYHLALETILEAYRIQVVLSEGQLNRDLTSTLFYLGLTWHCLGDMENALKFYLQAKSAAKITLDPHQSDVASICFMIAQVYISMGELKRSLDYFQQCLSLQRKFLGEDHLYCADTLQEMGNCELARGNLEGLMDYYSQARRIFDQLGHLDRQFDIQGATVWRFDIICPPAASMA